MANTTTATDTAWVLTDADAEFVVGDCCGTTCCGVGCCGTGCCTIVGPR